MLQPLSVRASGWPGVFRTGKAPAFSGPVTSSSTSLTSPEIRTPLVANSLVRFQGAIHRGRSLEIRNHVPINAPIAAAIQQELLLADIAAQSETRNSAHLKFFLGAEVSDGFHFQDQAAVSDVFRLVGRPVDLIAKNEVTANNLRVYLSATGNRFLYPTAKIYLGPVEASMPAEKNLANQVRRNLFNEYIRDLEHLIMAKSGETSQESVHQQLQNSRSYNALEALYYGKSGLTDGVLVGPANVVTREDLEKHYKAQKLTGKAIETFNRNALNIFKVPGRPLQSVFPNAVPAAPKKAEAAETRYSSLETQAPEDELNLLAQLMAVAPDEAKAHEAVKNTAVKDAAIKPEPKSKTKKATKKTVKKESTQKASPPSPAFFMATDNGTQSIESFPLHRQLSPSGAAPRTMIKNMPAKAAGILNDDTIFFPAGFDDRTAHKISEALLSLDDKKSAETQNKKNPSSSSHIKLVENTPGGYINAAQELQSTLNMMRTPVDVIVTGMAASSGTWLLSAATGNRFATPNARLMIHEVASGGHFATGRHYNESADQLEQSTFDYVSTVAEACERPVEEVWKDFRTDYWLNALESLFYGKKGMIDAVLVGPDKAITRQDALKYLEKALGGAKKAAEYIETKLVDKRDPRNQMPQHWQPEAHDKKDPFANPLATLEAIAASDLSTSNQFKPSLPSTQSERTVDYYTIAPSSSADEDEEGRAKNPTK